MVRFWPSVLDAVSRCLCRINVDTITPCIPGKLRSGLVHLDQILLLKNIIHHGPSASPETKSAAEIRADELIIRGVHTFPVLVLML